MLKITEGNRSALREARMKQAETRLSKRLARHWPETCAALGPEKLSILVRRGLDEAFAYGFHGEGDVARYLNLMFAFGPGFDVSGAHPAITSHLNHDGMDESARMDLICALAEEVLADGRSS